MEGEFDLNYSPLMELNLGKGLLVLCSLDIEDRGDPVAQSLTRRVIDYAATAILKPGQPVFYLGNPEGEALLHSLSVNFTKATGAVPVGATLVVGPGESAASATVGSVLASGGRVLAFGQNEIAAGPKVAAAPFGPVVEALPAWPELRGITPSDLRLRTEKPWPLLTSAPGWEIAANGLLGRKVQGKGVLLVFQGNPAALDTAVEPYYRISQWRWTRTLSQLLANLGASFENDSAFFDLKPNPFGPLELSGDWKVKQELALPSSASPSAPTKDPGSKDISLSKPEFDDLSWATVRLPAMNTLGPIDLEKIDGILWARRKIAVPAEWKGQGDLNLNLGPLDDHDITYFNGKKVGNMGAEDAKSWSKPRSYRIAAWMVKPGAENTIAVRLFDQFGGGGFGASGAPLSMNLELRKPVEEIGFYVPGFKTDKAMGDDPARYTRW